LQGASPCKGQASLFDTDRQPTSHGAWSSGYAYTLLADSAPAVATLVAGEQPGHQQRTPWHRSYRERPQLRALAPWWGSSWSSCKLITRTTITSSVTTIWESTTQGAIDGSNNTDLVKVIVGTTAADADGNFTYTPPACLRANSSINRRAQQEDWLRRLRAARWLAVLHLHAGRTSGPLSWQVFFVGAEQRRLDRRGSVSGRPRQSCGTDQREA